MGILSGKMGFKRLENGRVVEVYFLGEEKQMDWKRKRKYFVFLNKCQILFLFFLIY